ncbi:hypothetical protein ACEWY4_007498 [Coilia grayii]|uniref:HTH OST-type domain-containing protein n=1 Tax=Coilia grayii TaxID=363190 RepID=A0ABD1KGE8_9TELE
MTDIVFVKKLLRAVLQSSRDGVSLSRLQSDYRDLTGNFIQYKRMGYRSLEEFLKTMPSVVRLSNLHGEVRCFAVACQETGHIAELVARQRSSKKSGHAKRLTCHMRVKPASPFMSRALAQSCEQQRLSPVCGPGTVVYTQFDQVTS